MVVNVPDGGELWLKLSLPQQEIAPALLSAQEFSPPAATALKLPLVGGAVRLLLLSPSPQQEIAPVLRSAQACAPPALNAVKSEPVGGVARLLALLPQQASVPVLRSAHVWRSPALSAVKVVGVGVGVGVGVPGVAPPSSPLETSLTPPAAVGGKIVSSGRSSRRPQQLVLVALSAQEWRVPALTAR